MAFLLLVSIISVGGKVTSRDIVNHFARFLTKKHNLLDDVAGMFSFSIVLLSVFVQTCKV
jgi:hypothetical protein